MKFINSLQCAGTPTDSPPMAASKNFFFEPSSFKKTLLLILIGAVSLPSKKKGFLILRHNKL